MTDWPPQFTVSKRGEAKLGARHLAPMEMTFDQHLNYTTVTELQWEFIDHTIWLTHETLHTHDFQCPAHSPDLLRDHLRCTSKT